VKRGRGGTSRIWVWPTWELCWCTNIVLQRDCRHDGTNRHEGTAYWFRSPSWQQRILRLLFHYY